MFAMFSSLNPKIVFL